MIVGVPAAIPVTAPVPLPTAASPALLLDHDPPEGVEFKVVVKPTHTLNVPVNAVGVVFTVTTAVAATEPQLLVTVYDIVVVPFVRPATTPPEETVPTPVLVLLHVPPPVPLAARAVVAPVHTDNVPLIVPGVANGLMVTT